MSETESSNSTNGKETAKDTAKRRELPAEAVGILREWLLSPEHFDNPYPSPEDQAILITKTGIDKKQLKNWFINARRRIWKPMLKKQLEEAQNGGAGAHSRLVPILPAPSPSSAPPVNSNVPIAAYPSPPQVQASPPTQYSSASSPLTAASASNSDSSDNEQVLPEIVSFTPDSATMSKMGLGSDGTIILCSEPPPRLSPPSNSYEWSTFVAFVKVSSSNGQVSDVDLAKAVEAGDGGMFYFVVPQKLRGSKNRCRICLVGVRHAQGSSSLKPDTFKAVASTVEIALKSPKTRFESSSDSEEEAFLLSPRFQPDGYPSILILSQISEEVFEPVGSLTTPALASNKQNKQEDEDFQQVLRWIRDESTIEDMLNGDLVPETQANKRRRLAGGIYALDSEGLPQVPTPIWMPVLGEQVQVVMEYFGVGVLPAMGTCLGYSFYGICYTLCIVAFHTLCTALTDWGPESKYLQLPWTPLSPLSHVLWIDTFCALHLSVLILLFPEYFGPNPTRASLLVALTWVGDTALGYHTLLYKQRKGEIALRKISKSGKIKKLQ